MDLPHRIGWMFLVLALAVAWGRAQDEADFLTHVKVLSSDAMRGRGNGDPELRDAADYIAEQFQKSGVAPGGDDGGFFQSFDVTVSVTPGSASHVLLYSLASFPLAARYERDFVIQALGNEDRVDAPLAFAGFGIRAPELDYDDYAGLDVRGKAVVVFTHEPGEFVPESRFDGLSLTPYSLIETKAAAAHELGAAALILISDDRNHAGGREELHPIPEPDRLMIPVIRLSREWARRLWRISGRSSHQVWQSIHRESSPHSFRYEGVRIHIDLDLFRERRPVQNVVGWIPGTRQEALVIGAHYDHLGAGAIISPGGDNSIEIHNGADDNASGVAALIQLAEAFAGRQLGVNLVLVAFAGEELGLQGSHYFVDNPVFGLEETVAMFNLDMIGRSQGTLMIGGVGTSPRFQPLLAESADSTPLELKLAETVSGSSDHLSFSRRGVPVLFFFSGLHPDYHRPTDDWQKINVETSLQVVELTRSLVGGLDRMLQFPE